MTQDEKRIKIAEANGWTEIHPSGRLDGQVVGRKPGNLLIGKQGSNNEIPDYFHDLNACREMVNSLPETLRDNYQQHLYRVCDRAHRVDSILWQTINAAPEQRCEAFGLTIELWTLDMTLYEKLESLMNDAYRNGKDDVRAALAQLRDGVKELERSRDDLKSAARKLDKQIEVMFWTSNDGNEMREGTPEDGDAPPEFCKAWSALRSLIKD